MGTSHLKKGNLASALGTRQRYALRIPQLAPHAENSDKTLGLVFRVRRREFKEAGVVCWGRVGASGRCVLLQLEDLPSVDGKQLESLGEGWSCPRGLHTALSK